jgi:oligopeptide transport system substrate-binding protein
MSTTRPLRDDQASGRAFGEAVLAGVPPHSRRDLLRASAVLAAAAAGGRAVAGTAQPALAQDGIETDVELVIPFNPFGQVVSLDPHRAVNWGPFWVLLPHVWAGLLAFDENGAVIPDLAESVEPNETADTWTATLKPELTFANGNPITAQALVDGWKRALFPAAPAPMASFMGQVQGYDAYLAGESGDIGFAVIDDLTVEITLSAPWSSFPSALATFAWAAVDVTVLDDPDVTDLALADAGAGIWRFTEFVDGDRIVMEPNPNSPLAASPSISRITWKIGDGPDADQAALDDYVNDVVVSADVPQSLLETVAGDDTLTAELVTIDSQASTMAIGMDFLQAPFNDLRYRQAVAAAIDRETWANEIQAGDFVPATGIVPPVVSITSEYEGAEAVAFDPDQAASLLEDAGFDPIENAPIVTYFQPAESPAIDIERHAALLEMIAENSGLVITHDTSLTSDQIAALQRDNGGRQFDIVWWWTVTDTADLLRTIGQSESPYMAGWFNWSPELEGVDDQAPGDASDEFNTQVQAAIEATELAERNAAYQEAERLMLENAVYVPLGHWVQRYVQKPWLVGTRQGPWSGRIPVRFDEAVVVQGREEA